MVDTEKEIYGKFNPEVEPTPVTPITQVERFLGASRGYAHNLKPAEQNRYGLEGAAQATHIGLVGANEAVENKARDEMHVAIDATREEWEQRLQNYKNLTSAGVGPGGHALGAAAGPGVADQAKEGALSLLPHQPQVPGELQNIDRKAGVWDDARANGKMTETDYYGRMDSLRKDFITKYPGYRDFIDNTFEKYTGFNSANKLVESRIQDLNSILASNKDARKKTEDWVISHWDEIGNGTSDAASLLLAFRSGTMSDLQVLSLANERRARAYNLKQRKEELEVYKADSERQADKAYKYGVDSGYYASHNALENIFIGAGMDRKKIGDLITQADKGLIKIPPDQLVQLHGILDAHAREVEAAWEKDMYAPILNKETGKYGPSAAALMGETKMKQARDEFMRPFRTIQEAIHGKDGLGLLGREQATLNAQVSGLALKLFNEPGLDQFAIRNAAIKAFGQGADNILERTIGPPVGPTAQALKLINSRLAVSHSEVAVDANGNGYTFKKAIDDIHQFDPDGKNKNVVLSSIANIGDPQVSDEAQSGYAHALFSRANIGMIGKLENDSTDKDGNFIPGRQTVFNQVLSKLQATHDLAIKTGDAKLWEDAKEYVDREFRFLYQKNLISLNQTIANEGSPKGLTHGAGSYEITYNTDSHNFVVTPKPGRGIVGGYPGEHITGVGRADRAAKEAYDIRHAQQTIDRLNQGLEAMKKIAEAEGIKDPASIDENIMRMLLRNKDATGGSQAADIIYQMINHVHSQDSLENKPSEGKKRERVRKQPE